MKVGGGTLSDSVLIKNLSSGPSLDFERMDHTRYFNVLFNSKFEDTHSDTVSILSVGVWLEGKNQFLTFVNTVPGQKNCGN